MRWNPFFRSKHLDAISAKLAVMDKKLDTLQTLGANQMAAIDDLAAADVKLTAEVALIVPAIGQLQKTIADLNTALANAGANDPAIAKAAADMNAASDALAAALPAPAAPAPGA